MSTREWTPQPHPRLFFTAAEADDLRRKRRADGLAAEAWRRVGVHIERGMALGLPATSPRWEWDTGSDGQKNLSSVAGDANRAILSLGLSWVLDGVEAHARKATDLLLALCDLDFWTSQRFFGTDYRLPWRGTLETAILCHGAACGYDWLYEYMSEPERHRVRTCLLYKGILPLVQDWADPFTRLPLSTHIRPWGNWWQNCIAPAGEACMALWGEHPLVERHARLCREGSDAFFRFAGASVPDLPRELLLDEPGTYYPPNFDAAGGYWEGLNYVDGVLINSFLFGEAHRRQTGEEILPLELMAGVAAFILNGSFRLGDRMRAANFDDCRAGFATSPLVTAYLARRLRHGGLQWFLRHCRGNYHDASLFAFYESPPFTFLWYDPSVEARQPEGAASVTVYPGASWAVMRSGWGPDDCMLAFKCGATSGHAHPDAGSFVLNAREELLLVDSGCCGYEMPEQNAYYQTTRAHSTVLVGGLGQTKRLAGRLAEATGVPGLGFALGDAAAPYEGRLTQFLRGVLFVGNEYYVIADWLARRTDAPFQWLLHYDGERSSEGCTTVIRKGRAAVLVQIVEPEAYHVEVGQGYLTYHEDLSAVKTTAAKQQELERGEYLAVVPRNGRRRQAYLVVLYPFAAAGPRPRVTVVGSRGWRGVRVDRGTEVDVIGLRRTGAPRGSSLEGVQTDGRLFCLTRDRSGRPLRAFVRQGTYLRAGQVVLGPFDRPTTTATALPGTAQPAESGVPPLAG